MIQVDQAPGLNSLQSNANPIIIKVSSSRGANFYFKARILLNGVLFKTQNWSKLNNVSATVNLQDLYRNLFDLSSNPNLPNGLIGESSRLTRTVTIVVQEYSLISGQLIEERTLNNFVLVHSFKRNTFDFAAPFTFADILPDGLKVPADGRIRVPFYIGNRSTASMSILIQDDSGSNLYTRNQTTNNQSLIHFNINLSNLPIQYSTKSLKCTFTYQGIILIRNYVIAHNPVYPITPLYFTNNFGVAQFFYFMGERMDDFKYQRESYEVDTSEFLNYSTSVASEVKINTGYLTRDQWLLCDMISRSLDVRLLVDGVYQPYRMTTRKLKGPKGQEYSVDELLTFTRNQ